MNRTCWICFQSAAETPSNIRWISPCACKGDTQWSHEPCLLTWITRTQAQKKADGEDVPVLTVYQQGENQQQQDIQEALREGPPQQGLIQQFIDFVTVEEEDDNQHVEDALPQQQNVIKCPQCHTPYYIEIQDSPPLLNYYMKAVQATQATVDWMVPYVAFMGASYVVVISCVSYGVYSTVTLCGPEDILSQNIRNGRWNWRHWAGLSCQPGLMLMFGSRRLEATMASTGVMTLIYGLLTVRLQKLALEQNLPILGPLLVGPMSPLHSVIRQRSVILLGLLGFKRIYSLLRRNVMTPLIVGTTQQTKEELDNQPIFDIHFEDIDLNEDDSPASYPLFTILKMAVKAWTLPLVASTAGVVMKHVVKGSLKYTRRFIKTSQIDNLEHQVESLDTFMWSLLGGCSFTFVKDVFLLLYNRQKRLERMQMHLRDYNQ